MSQESKEVKLTIDGQEVVAQDGMSVLAAAKDEARWCLRCDLEFTEPAEENSDIARAGDLR